MPKIAVLILLSTLLASFVAVPTKTKTLYNSLKTDSIPQHLAFYELYPQSKEAQQALQHAWKLLGGTNGNEATLEAQNLIGSSFHFIISLVNKQPDQSLEELNDHDIQVMEQLGKSLANRRLKGSQVTTEAEVLALPPNEVDLARGIFLTQLGDANLRKIKSYEALIDLMALQILTKISLSDTPKVKINALNNFIFYEMGFRFPPHSEHVKAIDFYTFLPSVLDGRKGVCLGVSILYLCLAQRLDLPLEMITPPGHIYVRYRNGDEIINIETTARGIDLECEEYLGMNTKSLQQRNIKEVIGLAHYNQASVYWMQDRYEDALKSYERAVPYIPDDKLLKELMAYNMIFVGRREEGVSLLQQIKDHIPEEAVTRDTLAEDYLNGDVDAEGIKAVFMHVDENRESLIKKRERLENVLKSYPKFRNGWFQLAALWLQMHRHGEALKALQQYDLLSSLDPTAGYYLTILYAERYQYARAWEYLIKTEEIVKKSHHFPKALKNLRRELALQYPEPIE